jgi:hypothetical protein
MDNNPTANDSPESQSVSSSSSGSDAMSAQRPPRDIRFYLDNVTFLVEGTLFKVPRLYFEKNSIVFSDMFAVPRADDREGSTDENPINLESIEKVDFEKLLNAMFPDLARYTLEPIIMGRPEWVSVLKLSTLWRFGELREEALDELAQIQIDPIDKVILARDYSVEKWLVEGYTELVQRDAGLSAEERRMLGYEVAFQLYERREESFRRGLSRYGASRMFDTLEASIRDAFQLELAAVKFDGDVLSEVTAEVTGGFGSRGKNKKGNKKGKK